MSVHEAVLYGELVQYLRDVCAVQLAELRGSDFETEVAQLDQVIRAWFFTPQEDLHGFTPQQVIRNEELGLRNEVPTDHREPILDDEDDGPSGWPDDEAPGERVDLDGNWAFNLAPGMSLLDEYDPEGWDELWQIQEQRRAQRVAALKEEARRMPFAGADDPELARVIAFERRFIEDDDTI